MFPFVGYLISLALVIVGQGFTVATIAEEGGNAETYNRRQDTSYVFIGLGIAAFIVTVLFYTFP